MKALTAAQIEVNKALGLHPQFWETTFELPDEITPAYLDETFPAWRAAGQDMANAINTTPTCPQCLNLAIDCICGDDQCDPEELRVVAS